MDSAQDNKDHDSSGDVKNPLAYHQWTNEQQYYWTNEQALQLIQFYKEYISTTKVVNKKKILMWEHIAAQMRKVGYVYCTANHCATKYSSMIRQYRVVTENNLIPGNKKRTCSFYDALSEVYDYVPVIGESSTKSDEEKADAFSCNGQSSSPNMKLVSLIIKINDDKRKQEEKSLHKIETMHQEKMEMFSEFLKKLPVYVHSKKHTSTRPGKRAQIEEVEMVESSSDMNENVEDYTEDNKHNGAFDVISRTLAIALDPNEIQWTDPWSEEISNAFVDILEQHKSMWIDPTCEKQTFWELVASNLSKETKQSFKSQEVEQYFCSLTQKYKEVIDNNSKSGTVLITCIYFKQLFDLFSYNPKKWYYVPTVIGPEFQSNHTNRQQKAKRKEKANKLLSLLKTIHSDREEVEQRKMERLKRMHDDKMKMFSSFLDVVKKIKN